MKTQEATRAYPLSWPSGWPRTAAGQHKRARFKDRSVAVGRRILTDEIRRFGGRDLVISSNLELKLDGNPRSNQRQPDDRGVAVYFTRSKTDYGIGCDIYSTVEDNLWALVRTMDSLRQIERDGSPALLNRAFQGFAALPDPDTKEWWEVLNVQPTAGNDEIRQAFIGLAKKYHPDAGEGSDPVIFDQVQKAYDIAMGRLG